MVWVWQRCVYWRMGLWCKYDIIIICRKKWVCGVFSFHLFIGGHFLFYLFIIIIIVITSLVFFNFFMSKIPVSKF